MTDACGSIGPTWKDGEKDRREVERRIPNVVAQFSIREVARLTAENERLRAALLAAKRSHVISEDCWYSCPLSEEGCCDTSVEDECNCGADAHNAAIDKALAAAAPRESAQQEGKPQVSAQPLSSFGRADHDQDLAGRPLKPGS